MKHILLIFILTILIGCAQTSQRVDTATTNQELVGAWKAKIQFTSGAYATVKDMAFMYVFNLGGTMTESSNYDALPPWPPAYGVWRQTAPHTFEVHYECFATRAITPADSLPANSGWLPGGWGVLTETITVANDGKSYKSQIKLDMFDQSGKPIEGGGDATAEGVSLGF